MFIDFEAFVPKNPAPGAETIKTNEARGIRGQRLQAYGIEGNPNKLARDVLYIYICTQKQRQHRSESFLLPLCYHITFRTHWHKDFVKFNSTSKGRPVGEHRRFCKKTRSVLFTRLKNLTISSATVLVFPSQSPLMVHPNGSAPLQEVPLKATCQHEGKQKVSRK